MVHVPIDTGCTHRMPVSILHTHIITAIAMAMAGSSSKNLLRSIINTTIISSTVRH